MAKNRWIGRLAFGGWGLAFAAFAWGCPQFPDYPPFVRSGPGGGTLVAGQAVEGGTSVNDDVDGGDAGPETLVCYSMPTEQQGGAECDVWNDTDAPNDFRPGCASDPDNMFLTACPATGISPAGSLVGCCTIEPVAPNQITYKCYYAPNAIQQSLCTAPYVWSTTIPAP